MTARLREIGMIDASWEMHTQWTGRFSFTAVVNTMYSLGPWTARVLPGVTLTLNLVLLAWISRKFAPKLGLELMWIRALSLSALVHFAAIQFSPYPFQSFYWQNTLVNYTFPWGLLALLGILLADGDPANRHSRILRSAACGLLAFVASSFTEGLMAVELVALAGFATAAWLGKKETRLGELKRFRITSATAAVGGLCGALVVILAPGNAFRVEAISSADRSVFRATTEALVGLRMAIVDVLRSDGLLLAGLFLVFVLLGRRFASERFSKGEDRVQDSRRTTFLSGALIFIVLGTASLIPGYYALPGIGPPPRALVEPILLLVIVVGLSGITLGVEMHHRSRVGESARFAPGVHRLVTLLAVLILVTPPTVSASTSISAMTIYASERDSEVQKASEASSRKEASVKFDRLTTVRELDVLSHNPLAMEVGADPKIWLNACAAEYYGIEEVVRP